MNTILTREKIGLTMAEHIRSAVAEYLKKLEKSK
jgi:hypothetical protein